VRDLLRFASCSGGEEVDLRTTVQIGAGWFSSLFSPVPIPFCFYFIFFWFVFFAVMCSGFSSWKSVVAVVLFRHSRRWC
jgi:hypothetical protein